MLHAASASVQPKVTVVIPTLNEARNLPHVFSRLPAGIHEVIVVDGHSVDDTLATAERHWSRNKKPAFGDTAEAALFRCSAATHPFTAAPTAITASRSLLLHTGLPSGTPKT